MNRNIVCLEIVFRNRIGLFLIIVRVVDSRFIGLILFVCVGFDFCLQLFSLSFKIILKRKVEFFPKCHNFFISNVMYNHKPCSKVLIFIYLLQELKPIEYSQISPNNLQTNGLSSQQVHFSILKPRFI